MSTLKTNNIQHVDRSDPSIIINTDGSVNIAGTMTYEDVTNVDAVGIITGRSNIDAQKQVHVGTGVSIKAGGLNVTAGITTAQALQATTGTFSSNVSIAGITTISYTGTSQYGLDVYNPTSGASGARVRAGDSDSQYALLVENGAGTNLFEVLSGGGGARLRSGDLAILDKIAHYGDGNTFIRFPAADTVTIETAGSEALRVNSNGDVTTTGQASFDRQNAGFTARSGDAVSITRASGTPLEINRTGSDGQMISLMDDNTQEASIAISSGSLQFGVPNANTPRMIIDVNGNLGIATVTPRAKFDVIKASGNVIALFEGSNASQNHRVRIDTSGASSTSALSISNSNSNNQTSMYHSGGNNNLSIMGGQTAGAEPTAGTTRAIFSTGVELYYNGTKRLETSDGAINVNQGASTFCNFHHGGGNSGIRIAGPAAASGANLVLANNFNNSNDDRWAIQLDGSSDDLLFKSGGVSGTERFRIIDTGGITFNGATGTAHALDDYEEGTFSFNESNISVSNYEAKFTKIGRIVMLSARINFGSSTNTGTLNLTGLPFTPDSGAGNSTCGGVIPEQNVGLGAIFMAVEHGNNTVRIRKDNGAVCTPANMSNKSIRFVLWYIAT